MNASATIRPASHTSRRVVRGAIYAFLITMIVLFLVPVFLMVITSLKTQSELNQLQVWALPQSINLSAFQEAFEKLSPSLFNSIVLTVPATVISAMLGSLNGYVLSKWKFPGANIVFPLMLFGMFIPYQSILLPLFQTLNALKLGGSVAGLVVAHVIYGLPITTLIFRNYYSEVPNDLIEAAQIDGADFFGIYREVLFPLSLPGFVVVIIWQFTQIWNEYLFAVTLSSPSSQPITVALANLGGGQAINYPLVMAGSILTALPTLLVYIFLGRYFIRGLLAGSVKG